MLLWLGLAVGWRWPMLSGIQVGVVVHPLRCGWCVLCSALLPTMPIHGRTSARSNPVPVPLTRDGAFLFMPLVAWSLCGRKISGFPGFGIDYLRDVSSWARLWQNSLWSAVSCLSCRVLSQMSPRWPSKRQWPLACCGPLGTRGLICTKSRAIVITRACAPRIRRSDSLLQRSALCAACCGAGWAEAGDGETCVAPRDYQGAHWSLRA
jgi:hypothetical protein